ncbi:MAG: hypothetical protein M9926_16035 [Lentimicrobium sp.]|uniref:hypothetical protein n=1 Tax=Lentimicrobium sp. TaxID=2034841 RepID=UPI0025EE14EF|nr:hypothetical protein [Lentimicrobium sp.]MCO5258256.1 hypothetical protein [Lentimicrobium sp.]
MHKIDSVAIKHQYSFNIRGIANHPEYPGNGCTVQAEHGFFGLAFNLTLVIIADGDRSLHLPGRDCSGHPFSARLRIL